MQRFLWFDASRADTTNAYRVIAFGASYETHWSQHNLVSAFHHTPPELAVPVCIGRSSLTEYISSGYHELTSAARIAVRNTEWHGFVDRRSPVLSTLHEIMNRTLRVPSGQT